MFVLEAVMLVLVVFVLLIGDGMLLVLCEMGVVLWKEEGWVVYTVTDV